MQLAPFSFGGPLPPVPSPTDQSDTNSWLSAVQPAPFSFGGGLGVQPTPTPNTRLSWDGAPIHFDPDPPVAQSTPDSGNIPQPTTKRWSDSDSEYMSVPYGDFPQLTPAQSENWLKSAGKLVENVATSIATLPQRAWEASDYDMQHPGANTAIGPALETALLFAGGPSEFGVAARLHPELPPLPNDARLTGFGPFGPVVDGLKGRPQEAFDWLRDARTGEVRGLLNHPELPGRSIDVPYGDAKSGLMHIDEKHPGDADTLPGVWDEMKPISDSPNRTKLGSDKGFAVISKDFNGQPKDWLTTFFDPRQPRRDQPGGKSMGGAADEGPTSSDRLTNSNLVPYVPVSKPTPWIPFGVPADIAASMEAERQRRLSTWDPWLNA
jgi:hypothetical protein